MNKMTAPQPQQQAALPMAFVLLDKRIAFDGTKIETAVLSAYPHLQLRSVSGDGAAGTMMFFCQKMTVVILYMDMPIPAGWEPAAKWASAQWPEAIEVFSRHQAHLVVTVMGQEPNRLEAARMISAFTNAALVAYPESTGVLWDSTVASPKSEFMKYAVDAFSAYPKIPHPMWVSLHPSRDRATQDIVILTFGLQRFVGREIEIQGPFSKASAVAGHASGFVTYLLQNGPVIKDGDTIGISQTEKILVRLGQSRRTSAPVYSLILNIV